MHFHYIPHSHTHSLTYTHTLTPSHTAGKVPGKTKSKRVITLADRTTVYLEMTKLLYKMNQSHEASKLMQVCVCVCVCVVCVCGFHGGIDLSTMELFRFSFFLSSLSLPFSSSLFFFPVP